MKMPQITAAGLQQGGPLKGTLSINLQQPRGLQKRFSHKKSKLLYYHLFAAPALH